MADLNTPTLPTEHTPATAPPRLALSPREAADALGISGRLLWSLTNQGRVPCVRLGRRVVYPVRELEQWLSEQAVKGGLR